MVTRHRVLVVVANAPLHWKLATKAQNAEAAMTLSVNCVVVQCNTPFLSATCKHKPVLANSTKNQRSQTSKYINHQIKFVNGILDLHGCSTQV